MIIEWIKWVLIIWTLTLINRGRGIEGGYKAPTTCVGAMQSLIGGFTFDASDGWSIYDSL
jgi:hypothetical protein